MPDQISEAKISELADLISRGRKIEAIKLYRELTGLGLKEAKEAIEALEVSVPRSVAERPNASPSAGGSPVGAHLPQDKLAVISESLFRGNKVEAIKLYRDATNVGLRDAKEQIEALEASLRGAAPEKFVRAPVRKGCFGAAAAFCFCGLVALYWFSRT